MKTLSVILLSGLIICCQYSCSDKKPDLPKNTLLNESARIIIESQLQHNYYANLSSSATKIEESDLLWTPYDYIGIDPDWNTLKQKYDNNGSKWVIYPNKPLLIMTPFQKNVILLNPGDSICINYNEEGIKYSGSGAVSVKLQEEINKIQKNFLIQPTKSYIHISSLEDYFKWKEYLDKRLRVIMTTLDLYKGHVSDTIYNEIKSNAICRIEMERAESFVALMGLVKKNIEITPERLSVIYDTTLNEPEAAWLRSNTCFHGDIWYFYQLNRMQIWRGSGFDLKKDSLLDKGKKGLLYYTGIKNNFTGLLRERLIQYHIVEAVIKKHGITSSITDTILNDYYTQPGFPEYKQWMRKFVEGKRNTQFAKK
jgi:hypothetical protein